MRNVTQNLLLGDAVERADRFRRRLLGLMFQPRLHWGGGLWLEPCRSVHTHFMRFPIDLLFLDQEGRVVRVIRALQPWRISPVVREAVAVLELPAGAAGPTSPGDRVVGQG